MTQSKASTSQAASSCPLLAWGAGLYALHLAALPLLTDSAFLWALTLAGGVGGAAIITLPIGYYQDLLRERPGAAASMLAVQKLVADVVSAGAFFVGTLIGGYESVALIGVAISAGGALALMLADRRGWLRPDAAGPA